MITRDGTYYFGVHATVPGDANGTLVTVQKTKEGGGWHLGDVRADDLNQVLEDTVNAAEQQGVKTPNAAPHLSASAGSGAGLHGPPNRRGRRACRSTASERAHASPSR
jgi:hypothetical protein